MNFNTFELKTERALKDCKGQIKHCAENALINLKKADKLKKIDPEISAFRAITAEEEAASSVFLSLKSLNYINSKKLLFKNHVHKQALYPYIQSVMKNIKDLNDHNGNLVDKTYLDHTEHNKRKAINLLFTLKSQDFVMTPIPPLNFNITYSETGKVLTFEDSFKKAYQGKQFSTALKSVQQIADIRNQLLYAQPSGKPKIVTEIDIILENQKHKVFSLLNIMLMIDPWKNEGHSPFVQQALDGFLFLLSRIEENEICPPYNGGQ